MALLSGLRKVAPGAGGACLAIGAYFGCSVEKRASKQLKMVGWNSRCYCSYFGTDAIISWLQANAKF